MYMCMYMYPLCTYIHCTLRKCMIYNPPSSNYFTPGSLPPPLLSLYTLSHAHIFFPNFLPYTLYVLLPDKFDTPYMV